MKKLIKLLAIATFTLASLCACGEKEESEFEKTSVTYAELSAEIGEDAEMFFIGTVYYEDYQSAVEQLLYDLYNPANEQAYDKAKATLLGLMTEPCAKGFSTLLNPYTDNREWVTVVTDIQYGLNEWQPGGDTHMLIELTSKHQAQTHKFFIEFKLNEIGKVKQCDIW